MKSRFSKVLGKLDSIESLLRKQIIFVLLCFAQISQTLHVCGATMKSRIFLLGIPVVVLHGLFVKLGLKTKTPKKTQKLKCHSSEVQRPKKSCKKLPKRIKKSTKVS